MMTVKTDIYLRSLLASVLILGALVSCNVNDGRQTEGMRFEMLTYVADMGEEMSGQAATATRAGSELENYSKYVPVTSAAKSQIGVYMAQSDRTTDFSQVSGTFNYAGSGKWETFFDKSTPTGQYYIYGYMPVSIGTATLSSSDYTKGARMTLTGVNPVSDADVCVIVGVAETSDNLHLGSYGYNARYNGDQTNKLTQMMDHIFSRVQIKMSVDYNYSKIRTIKVKSMSVTTPATIGRGRLVIDMPDVSSGSLSPMSVTFTQTSSGDASPVSMVLQYTDKLPTSSVPMASFYCPTAVRSFILSITYDVLDKEGEKVIRGDCSAVNAISMPQAFDYGISYDLNIDVAPSYLYHLDDMDVDSPVFHADTN